jgi:hypothetical protein
MNHMELKNAKGEGSILPVIVKKYIVVVGMCPVYASRKDVLELPGLDKDLTKAFLKENKINWKDPQDLMKVHDFIASNQKIFIGY